MHLKYFTFLFLFLAITSNTYAFKLSPIVQTFGLKGAERTKSFKIINTTQEEIMLEVEATKRVIAVDNTETRPETDDFIVYPPQLKVPAGKTQTLRVSYVGKPVAKEEAYRLIVRQIPNKLKKKKEEKTQINFLFEYVASLYISPGNTKPNLQVKSATSLNNRVNVIFENEGTEHILMRNLKLQLEQGKKKKEILFSSKEYEKLGSQNILAGIKREITINNIEGFKPGKVAAKFIKVKD